MKDKFCFNRTLLVLVLIVVGVVFGLVAMKGNLSISSKAGGICDTGVAFNSSVFANCTAVATTMGSPYISGPAAKVEGYICCIVQRAPVPTTNPGLCSSKGGRWLNVTACTEWGRGYTEATGVTETRTGFKCCLSGRAPVPPTKPGLCSSKGGRWLAVTACTEWGRGYTEATGVTETRTGFKCCLSGRAAVPTVNPGACLSNGGYWYQSAFFPVCTDVGPYYSTPATVTEVKAGYICCKDNGNSGQDICGYSPGESCWKTSDYVDCNAVKTALGGNYRTPGGIANCPTDQFCCVN